MTTPDTVELQIRLKVLAAEPGTEQDTDVTASEIFHYLREQGYEITAAYEGKLGPGEIWEFLISISQSVGGAVLTAVASEIASKLVSEAYQHIADFLKAKRLKNKELPAPVEAELLTVAQKKEDGDVSLSSSEIFKEALKQAPAGSVVIITRKTTTENSVEFRIP